MQRSSPSIASSLCQGEAVGQAVAPLAARIVARCGDLARGSPAVVLFVRSACAFLAGVMARRPPMRCLPALLLPGDLQMLNRLTARMLSLSRGHHRPASQPTEWARETRSASRAEPSPGRRVLAVSLPGALATRCSDVHAMFKTRRRARTCLAGARQSGTSGDDAKVRARVCDVTARAVRCRRLRR